MDASGNLFIADTLNNRIREVALGGLLPRLRLNQVSAADAGNYQVIITSPYGCVTSAVATLTVVLPPSISAQPANFFAPVGGAASFSAAVIGTPPLSYAWYFNRTNLLADGTNATLSLPNVSLTSVGGYTLVVTNIFGSVTSRVATLSVGHLPTIANEPTNQSALFGSNATLHVTAAGDGPLSYQWQLNGTNFPNDININIITTVAGGGITPPGDPWMMTETNASLAYPSGVAVDPSGNLFIADTYHLRILKIDRNGIITTVAGNPVASNYFGTYSGDGGAATNAGLNGPTGLALDASGNLFIADSGNNRIRKVDAKGVITTVAGNGAVTNIQYNGQTQGYYSGDGGAATNASLYSPSGVVVDDSGNLFIADTGNNRIRKVGAKGVITTVAGNGNAIPDINGNYGPEDGYYSGDGGAATNAVLNGPAGVAVDASGNLFIADSGNNRIRKVDANGVITTVAGNSTVTNIQYYGSAGSYSGDGGAATNAGLSNPSGVAVDASGNLFIADDLNFRIRKVDVNGIITTVAGNGPYGYGSSPNTLGDGGSYPYGTYSGDSGAATNASLNYSYGVTVDASGNLFIADSGNNRIREIAPGGLLPQLSLNQASASTAGNFQVIIIGPYGSVTSTVASVTVLLPPSSQIPGKVMSVPLIAGNNVILGFSLSQTTSASLLTLLQAPSLTGPWTTNAAAVLTRNAQTGGYQFSVPVTGSVEFYQLRSP